MTASSFCDLAIIPGLRSILKDIGLVGELRSRSEEDQLHRSLKALRTFYLIVVLTNVGGVLIKVGQGGAQVVGWFLFLLWL